MATRLPADGFGAHFFKDNWQTVGEVVSQVILDFFSSGKLLGEVNATLVSLIPKTKCPKDVTVSSL